MGIWHGEVSLGELNEKNLACLNETLASWAGYLAVDRSRFHVVGREINANHIRPVSPGGWVYGEAIPANIGRRAHVWEVKLTNGEGKLVCISRCTLAVLEVPGAYATPDQRGQPAGARRQKESAPPM
ncbi:hypothetical protein NCCP1664_15910 [Zafaria cholistanensis]|uniref:Thioesterase domain-containing protein n=1 Tax=Zafaria cholistanensis TaxID=1682741 RepID=A0A5A7NQS7_9MICC|nr:PaaI family thioesterase [Zafaria cholistanensis]GER23095.1 hypothetical protein NCCP1664_15910 [Zafaria cholistanensis]